METLNLNARKRSSLFKAAAVTAALSVLSVSTAYAACTFPIPIQVPSGKYATEEEMIDTQGRVKAYMASADAYLICLDEEMSALTEAPSEEQLRIRDMRHNAAVDEMEKLAAQFNAEVRIFKKSQ